FIISGEIPSFIDAFFETVSGFTTTGASILSSVETLSKSIIFWRSFTHWIGGMGVLIFVIAALPLASGGSNIYLMRAESPGPDVSKLVPSSRGTAFRLYSIYFAITVLEIVLLLCFGNSLFDSLTLSFGTAGTGGFAIRDTSLADYNSATQIIITVFMTAFGVNFSCYYLLLLKKFKDFFKNEEVRAYLGILICAIAIITINTAGNYDNAWVALKHAAFQASSVMTTTGYVTVDFNKWPELSRMVMLLIMCVGACVGSTGGGIKVARILILAKEAFRQFKCAVSPNRVESVRFNGRPVGEAMITGITSFFILYMMMFVASVLILSFDNKDTVSNISGVIATLNNIGPGLGIVGAVGNYGSYSVVSKMVFIIDMLAGRLEILPLLALFSRRTWAD
ncbi:MAG: TrkH family potassium uptake protein, partial [Acetivibrionales bacterium]